MNTRLEWSRAWAVFMVAACVSAEAASDWPQFRGPNAHGRSDVKGLPLTWSDEKNIAWKTALPGPGASSPILHGERIYLTCFTGFGLSSSDPGEMTQLRRHLLCIDGSSGRILWNSAAPAEMPEQERIRENHGYASSTPVTDGERIYVFYGKSGVMAYDMEGKQLWKANVGSKLNGWGSATSPVLHKNLVLVNASVESEALIALDKATGKEVWRAPGVKESWHAPAVVNTAVGDSEIVMATIRRLMAFNPADGKELWRCDTGISWYMCPTPVSEGGIVYAIGGRTPNGALAVKAGGRGDVSATHTVWKVTKGSNVPTPILHDGHLYFAHENLGVALCLNARTGEVVYEERMSPSPGQVYASPVLGDGRIYYTGRGGHTVVLAAKPKYEVLGESKLESGRGVFNASAAISGKRMLMRSNKALYCLEEM